MRRCAETFENLVPLFLWENLKLVRENSSVVLNAMT